MASGNYALVQVMRARAQHNVPLVPQIVAGGGVTGQKWQHTGRPTQALLGWQE
ncbi:MAG TPA: hypothetical protein VG714_03095 [Acidobacteriaceae bacterium]|nr:hypothetical protein [Acidobacteriaceae bacterium]